MAPTVDFGPVKYGCTKYKRRMVLYESVSHAGKRFEFCYSSSYRDKRGVETAYYKCVGCMHAKRYNDGRRIPKIAVRENRLVNSNPDRPSNFPHFCHPIDMALSDRRQREREITTQYPAQANRAPELQLLTLPGLSRRSDSADNSPTCPATAAVFPPLLDPQPFMAQQPMAQQQQPMPPMPPMDSSAAFFQQYHGHQHHQPMLTKAAIQQLLIDGTTMATTMALTSAHSTMASTSAHSTSAGKSGHQQHQHLVTQPMASSASSSSLAASSSMMMGPEAAFLTSAQVCRPTPVHHPAAAAAAAVSMSSPATATLSGGSHPHDNHYYKQLQQQQMHQHLPQFPANFHAAASVQQQIQRLAADCFAQQQQQEVVRQQQQKQEVEVARQQLFACQQQRQEVARQQQLHHHQQRHHQQFRPNESAIVSAAATAMPLALLGMAAVGGWPQPAATNGSNHHAGGHQPATMNGNQMMFS